MSARPSRFTPPLPPPLPPGLDPSGDPIGTLRLLLAGIDTAVHCVDSLDASEQLAMLRHYRTAFLRLIGQVRDAWVMRIVETLDAAGRERLRAWVMRIEMARQDQNLCDMEAVRLFGPQKRAYLLWGLEDLAGKLDVLLSMIDGRLPDPARPAATRAAWERFAEA